VRPLAALALAGTLFAAVVQLADFLSYGTTAQVARLHGAGKIAEAGGVVAQALWLALGAGVLAGAVVLLAGGPLLGVLGRGAGVHGDAELYIRIAAAGVPAQLVALAGEGCLRGLGDLRSGVRAVPVYGACAGRHCHRGTDSGGAGDTRYLARAMVLALAVFLPLALAASTVTGLWWALNLLILARLLTLVPRFARRRWVVLGARV
jgi:Na+-driven multidrug efflux pump